MEAGAASVGGWVRRGEVVMSSGVTGGAERSAAVVGAGVAAGGGCGCVDDVVVVVGT